MKSLLAFVLLLWSLSLCAQTAAPSPTPSPTPCTGPNCGLHFITEANVYQNSDGTTAQAFAAAIPLSRNWRGGLQEVVNPDAKGDESFVFAEFRHRLGDLFGQSKSKAALNLDNIHIFARALLGDEQATVASGKQRYFALGVLGGARVKLGTVAGMQTSAGLSLGFIGVPQGHEHFVLGNPGGFNIAPGVEFSF